MGHLRVVVGTDLRLVDPPSALAEQLKKLLTYPNPAYSKALRYKQWKKPPKHIHNYRDAGRDLHIPRGVARRLRVIAEKHGITIGWRDLRIEAPVGFPSRAAMDRALAILEKPVVITPRQETSIAAMVRRENAYLRASTGYGKTIALLAAIREVGQRALYIVPGDLTRTQVLASIEETFGDGYGARLETRPYPLAPINVATYDLAWNLVKSRSPWSAEVIESIGALVCDEAHKAAAPTRVKTIEAFPARYRWGATATPIRKDGLHSLMFDLFGSEADHITYDEAVEAGRIVRVRIRIVTSNLRDRDYEIVKYGLACSSCTREVLREEAPDGKRCDCGGIFETGATLDAAMNAQLYELAEERLRTDPGRNAMIADRVAAYHAEGHSTLVMVRRIEHGETLLEQIRARGIEALMLRGGASFKKDRTAAIEQLKHGTIRAAVGTSTSFEGLSVDRFDRGIVAIPSANNLSQLAQMRGRFCRLFEGKDAWLDYIHDRYLFPAAARNLRREFGADVYDEEEET